MPTKHPHIKVYLSDAMRAQVRTLARLQRQTMSEYLERLIAADFAARGVDYESLPRQGDINRIPSRREKMVVVTFDALAREFDIHEVTEPPASYTQAIRNEALKLTAYLRGFPWTEDMLHDLKLELMGL